MFERPLQIAVAVIAGLGTMMLGVSEEHYALAAAAVVVSIAAFWLCDVTGWLRLNVLAANIGAILAVLFAGLQLGSLGPEARVLALADLMGYLQFVLLFKPKTTRNYWLLAVVSFLQVSVAAALNTGLFFAVMLAAYLIAAVFFLGLFYLYREAQRAVEATQLSAAVDGANRYGLFARPPQLPPSSMLGDWTQRLVAMILGTVALAAIFFIAVPRIGQANWIPQGIVAGRSVGFAPEMNLTRSGEIVEDPELVMRVQFFDDATGQPYQVDGEPYLRGTSVTHYSAGRWRAMSYSPSRGAVRPPPPGTRHGLVRQATLIEPLASSTTLFAAAPAFSAESADSLRFNPFVGRFDRTEPYRGRRFSYELLTTGFRRNRQLDLLPQWEELGELGPLVRLPPPGSNGDSLSRLKAVAANIVADIPVQESYRRAKALEAYLRDSGQFAYTLDTPESSPGVDPLDEFVAVHRRGHCELFAGALALMLRSVNIPARVVLGYRGGEYNVMGNFYLVRQLHAHSWVEAYLLPDHLPQQRLAAFAVDDDDSPTTEVNGLLSAAKEYGVWLQLDPTTGNDVLQSAAADSSWGEVQQVLDYFRFLWGNYVVGMDSEKQRESVYLPVREWLAETAQSLRRAETWRHARDSLLHYINPLHWLPHNVPLFSWRGGLILTGIVVCAWSIGLTVYYRLYRRRNVRAVAATKRRRSPPPPVDFYVRLESALRRRNLTRTPEQTPREFVVAACGELAELPATRGVSNLPRKIVEAFYRVRFGGRPLTETELTEVENALTQLTAALTPNTAAGSG